MELIKKILMSKKFKCPRCKQEDMMIQQGEDSYYREAYCYHCEKRILLKDLKNYVHLNP